MIGLQFYRMKRHLSFKALVARSGVSETTIRNYENKTPRDDMQIPTLLSLAEALGVTIEMLVADYDPADLAPGDHHAVRVSSAHADKPLTQYRVQKNYTMQQVGDILGIHRQHVDKLSKLSAIPPKYLQQLCEYEGITPDVFLERYGSEVSA